MLDNEDYLSDRILKDDIKEEFVRYFSFWPYFLISIIFSLILAYLYIRYSSDIYLAETKIEIIDKANDSEMALPTAMTVFNRSMINLDNEIGVLSSFRLNEKVIKSTDFNIELYNVGRIKKVRTHKSDWFENYDLSFKFNSDSISKSKTFNISIENNRLEIQDISDPDNILTYNYNGLSTYEKNSDLMFDLKIMNSNQSNDALRQLVIRPVDLVTNSMMANLDFKQSGENSDQLILSMLFPNYQLAEDYLNALVIEFDKDGVKDRQLEYERTMEFVDNRSVFLQKELEKIEISKQEFKENNNLSDIKYDVSVNTTQKFSYDAELFEAESQRDLVSLLKDVVSAEGYKLMPVNIGLKNETINELIIQYNLMVKDLNRYSDFAGPNNTYFKNLKNDIAAYAENISISIDNYSSSLDILIDKLKSKEQEFDNIFDSAPLNEKILRSINRELEVKESLFLLLLQKREEAAINLAVVKPSIKLIDSARGSLFPVAPNKLNITLVFMLVGIFIPFIIIYLIFFFDNKIHARDHLEKATRGLIPILGEIPFIKDVDKLNIFNESSSSRLPLIESSRMILSNLDFVKNMNSKNIILVTSAIKGEGKTLVSSSVATVLSHKFKKVLLVGADLRNPQIHKILGVPRTELGLSDYVFRDDIALKDILIKRNNLDILLSGTIPPNPIDLLSSEKCQNLIDALSNEYDYIVIDSAPILLVADTFELTKKVSTSICVFRANYTNKNLCNFLIQAKEKNDLKSMNLVFNSVGNSGKYGYKYGYQYGYRYGYKYGYNYGYGYGYGEDD